MHDNELRRGHLRFSGGKLAGNEAGLLPEPFVRPRLLNPGQKEELSADSVLNKNKIKATSI